MIRLTEPGDGVALAAFCGDSLCGTYIMSRFLCYGNDYEFARCFADISGEVVRTAVSVLEGSAVLLAGDDTDFEELAFFFGAVGVRMIMTDEKTAQRLPFPIVKQKVSLRSDECVNIASAVNDATLRDVYDLISAAIPDAFSQEQEAYLRFLSDYTFRWNRGRARLKAVVQNDRLCACALTAAESDTAAVISGVACRADCRGRGYGKVVVSNLAADLQREHKSVYVIALHDKAVGFYEKLGFRQTGKMTWLSTD